MLLILYFVQLRIIPPEQTQDLPLNNHTSKFLKLEFSSPSRWRNPILGKFRGPEYVSKPTAICRNFIDF